MNTPVAAMTAFLPTGEPAPGKVISSAVGHGRLLQPLRQAVQGRHPRPVRAGHLRQQHLPVKGERHEPRVAGQLRHAAPGMPDPGPPGVVAADPVPEDGRNNRPQESRHYHRMASTAAAAVGREHTGSFFRHWTTFGPLTVGMKDVEDAMILGDARTVVRKSSQDAMSPTAWKNTGRPSDDNWNRHRMDVARAHARTGDLTAAMDELAGVRRASPEWLRHQRMAAETMQEILKKRKRTLTAEMREMTAYLGVVGQLPRSVALRTPSIPNCPDLHLE